MERIKIVFAGAYEGVPPALPCLMLRPYDMEEVSQPLSPIELAAKLHKQILEAAGPRNAAARVHVRIQLEVVES